MIHRALVLVALACSGLVAGSFLLFVRDQMSGASKQQVAAVYGTTTGQVVAPSAKPQGQPGRFINGAARTLTSPFSSIVQSGSAWVERIVPTVLALLVYGVGLGYLARFSSGFA